MGRRVDADQLVAASEIKDRLGLRSRQHVHWLLANDATFPEPVARVGGPEITVAVWYWPDVQRWARRTGRLPEQGKGRSR